MSVSGPVFISGFDYAEMSGKFFENFYMKEGHQMDLAGVYNYYKKDRRP